MTNFTVDWYGEVSDTNVLAVIRDAIQHFSEEEDDYIVVRPDPSVQNSVYMQAHSPTKRPKKYRGLISIEIRFEFPDGTAKHCQYWTGDKDEVYCIFADYVEKETLPDLAKFEDMPDLL